jgi:hypothetical protein
MECMLSMVVTETDCARWSECWVWLLQRETAQDGVSTQYDCDRETAQDGVSAQYGCDRERLCRME